jgi:hypothetical protein
MAIENAPGQNSNNPAAAAAQPDAAPAAAPQDQPPATPPATDPKAPDSQPAANAGEGDQKPAEDQDGLLKGTDPQKPEGEEGKEGDEEKPSVLGAPEEGYQFEGFNPADAGVQAFSEVAKELDLSQDSANKLMAQTMAGIQAQLAKQRAELRQQALSDKELGFTDPAVVNRTNAVFGKYFAGKPQLMAKIRAFNLDVDPDFIGVMKQLGADMSEGTFVQGKKGAVDTGVEDYRKLYPNTRMNY